MISERLRAETAGHHHAIENAKRFSRLGSDDFTQVEYVQVLEKFYGFYQPLEEAYRQHPDVLEALNYERRFKLPLLKKDLLHFGHTEDSLTGLERCNDLPPLQTKAQILGCMYVMEGSTHGSQMIAKKLRQQLHLGDEGLSFYEGYGQDTMAQWKAFKSYLDSAIAQQEGDVIVSTAGQTFDALHRWMDR
jgi:heme oxygenase (biliverdin-IX-beta and delta-forming)